MRFEFRARRTGRPQHALHAQSGRKHIAENSRARSVGGKISEEIRRLPVGDAGQNQLLDVLQHRVKRLALCRAVRRQRGANSPGFTCDSTGNDSIRGLIVGDPVHHGVAVAAEFVGRHVEGFFVGHFSPMITSIVQIDARVVVEGHAPRFCVLIENAPQFAQHRAHARDAPALAHTTKTTSVLPAPRSQIPAAWQTLAPETARDRKTHSPPSVVRSCRTSS